MRTLSSMKESLGKIDKVRLFGKLVNVYLLFITINALSNWIRSRKSNKASDDLVRSNPQYNNVFLLKSGLGQGTAVYIGNNMLITAAHCLSINPNETSKINENLHQFTFHETNSKWKITSTYHAKRIFIHPGYTGTSNPSDSEVDLALIQLKENITHLRGLELNFEHPTNNWTWVDTISIGYSYRMPPRNSLSLQGYFARKIAVTIPQAIAIDQRHYLLNILGYNIDLDQCEIHKQKYNPLENGTHHGMSGGPLLHNNKVIGINAWVSFDRITITNTAKSQKKEFSCCKHLVKIHNIAEKIGCVFQLDGKLHKFMRLDTQKAWIEQILEQCRQNDLLNPKEAQHSKPMLLSPLWRRSHLLKSPDMYEEYPGYRMPIRQRC